MIVHSILKQGTCK